MSGTIQTPQRQFRIGTTNLADPDPSLPAEQVFQLYAASYPALRFAAIQEPRLEGEVLVIEAKLPAVQTKGNDDVLAQLGAWIAAPSASPDQARRWAPVASFIGQKLDAPATPHLDAFLLPLA